MKEVPPNTTFRMPILSGCLCFLPLSSLLVFTLIAETETDTPIEWYQEITRLQYNICQQNSDCRGISDELVSQFLGDYADDADYDLISCCRSCSCDDVCFDVDMCCPNELLQLHNQLQNTPLTCGFPALRQDFIGYGVEMIQFCPGSYKNDTVRKLCQLHSRPMSLKDAAPVSHSSDNTIYANLFCALCNNVTNITPWIPSSLECYDGYFLPADEQQLLREIWDTECNVIYSAPHNVQPEACIKQYRISKCNMSGLWKEYDKYIDTACSAIYAPYNGTYRNEFCFLCNDERERTNDCENTADTMTLTSFSALLNFAKDSQEKSDTHLPLNNCQAGFVYDYFQRKCLEIHCPFGYHFNDGSCQEGYLQNIWGPIYVTNFKLSTEVPMRVAEASTIGTLLSQQFFSILMPRKYNVPTVCKHTWMIYQTENNNSSKIKTFNYRAEIGTRSSSFTLPTKFIAHALNLDGTNQTFTFGNESILFHLQLYQVSGSETFLKSGHFLYMDNQMCSHDLARVELKRALLCPLIELNKADLPWKLLNSGMVIETLDLFVCEMDFLYEHGQNTILICLDTYIPKTEEMARGRRDNSRISQATPVGYVTFICVLLSVSCLMLTLVTYTIFSDLRTQPGIYNMILSTGLLVAQLLFQFGIGAKVDVPQWVCVFLGMLTHFAWLFVIFWMNVCSFHMTRVFKNESYGHQKKRTSILYICYTVIMSAIFLAVNIVVSHIQSDGTSLGYGDGNECYISSGLMLGITFAGPVGLVILANLCFFVFTVVKISGIKEVAKENQQNRNMLLIYTRLSTITGLTWVFGFVYAFTSLAVFEYLFSVLNAGQGVLIMLAFVVNKKVLTLYKGLFASRKENTSLNSKSEPEVISSSIATTHVTHH